MWLVSAGVYGVWAASVVGSFQALYGLANGYGGWPAGVAIILPGTLDTYWLTALQVAMNRGLKTGRRAWAAVHGAVAFLLSVAGNGLYHELHSGQWHLGNSAPMVVAVISSLPLLAAAAMTHLRSLMNPPAAGPEKAAVRRPAVRAKKPAKRTAPPDHPRGSSAGETQPPHLTTPPPQATTPPDRPTGTAPSVSRGGRPDPEVIAAAERMWDEAFASGKLHTRRTLQKAVNDSYGRKVIGESACDSIVKDRREARRRTA